MRRRSYLASLPAASILGGCVMPTSEDPRSFLTGELTGRISATDPEFTLRHLDDEPSNGAVGPDDAGEVVFELARTGSEAATLETPPVAPFGPLVATDGDHRVPLWHDDYETTDGIDLEGGEPTVTGEPASLTLAPDETISRTYDLRHADLTERLPVGIDSVFEVAGDVRFESSGEQHSWQATFRCYEFERYD